MRDPSWLVEGEGPCSITNPPHPHTHTYTYEADVAVRPSPRNPKFVQPLLYPSLAEHEASDDRSDGRLSSCKQIAWNGKGPGDARRLSQALSHTPSVHPRAKKTKNAGVGPPGAPPREVPLLRARQQQGRRPRGGGQGACSLGPGTHTHTHARGGVHYARTHACTHARSPPTEPEPTVPPCPC